MKTMRYILSLIAILSAISLSAATYGTLYKTHERRPVYITQVGTPAPIIPMSTLDAPMMHSGSALPMAAITGTITSYDQTPKTTPHRAKRGADGEDTPPSDPQGPMEDPLGNAALPLFLLACVYICARAFLRRKRA